jgi:membrane protease YdiL (CAAX protease family)
MNELINESGFTISVVILSTVIIYYIYFYFVNSNLPKKLCAGILQPTKKEIVLFLIIKCSGFMILGLIPGIIYYFFLDKNFGKFGLSVNHLNNSLFLILSLITVIAVVLFINQKTNKQHNSLQINISEWNVWFFLINATGWIIYLVGYEFLFRGILLFECYSNFGFLPAIAINVAIYSAIHLVNGKFQTFGAFIFGCIASFLTLRIGTLSIPILMHVSLSLFSDYFSIRYNESLSFVRQKSFNLPQK